MEEIEKILNYSFKNKNLLQIALNHSSYAHNFNLENNEKLEFLGDSVLSLLVTEFLIDSFPYDEGKLSKLRAKIVGRENLSRVIDNLSLTKFLRVYPENIMVSCNMKCDFYEAILGAIYLDGGYLSAKDFMLASLNLTIKNINNLNIELKDYKTLLQETLQKDGVVNIEYRTIEENHINNKNFFKIALFVNNEYKACANGESKHEAENEVAKIMLKNLGASV